MPTRSLCALFLCLAVPAFASAAEAPSPAHQVVAKAGAQTSAKGPAANFSGDVRVDPLLPADESTLFSAGQVTFQPGARSAWHIHPAGQYLIVLSGSGWTQEWGGQPVALHAGDAVWCPPGVKHWHGASRAASLVHVALSGSRDGQNVRWLEKVSDEQYPR